MVSRVDLIARPAKTPKLYAEVSHEVDMDLEAIVSSAVAELGYDSVKPEQKAALLAFLRGRDVFVSLPTGYGKSLCYAALPAAFDSLRISPSQSIVVVVSPLIALMKDQVATPSSGALRHGIQFLRKNYARGGHMTRFYVSGRGVTYIHNDKSTSARLLSSTKLSIEFAEVKNDENELEGWRPRMFFGGTNTNLMEEREFFARRPFYRVKCSTVLCTIYLLWHLVQGSL